jgi:hypothetical protein
MIKANIPGKREEVLEDCIKEGCAWWDEEKNCCSLKVIAKELTRLQLSKK